MKTDRQAVKAGASGVTGAIWNNRADRVEVSARFARRHEIGPRLVDIARQDRRAESVIYPLLCACGLFGIATHFASAVPDAHQMEAAMRECLRLAGIC